MLGMHPQLSHPVGMLQVRFVDYLPLLVELLDNSITYRSLGSAKQSVRVAFEAGGFENGSGRPEIRVSDQGRGMGKDSALGYFVQGHTSAGTGTFIPRGETQDTQLESGPGE